MERWRPAAPWDMRAVDAGAVESARLAEATQPHGRRERMAPAGHRIPCHGLPRSCHPRPPSIDRYHG